jgi:hypothetical protein
VLWPSRCKIIREGRGEILKKLVFLAILTGFIGSAIATAQEKTASTAIQQVNYAPRLYSAQPYSPDQIKTMGTLDSGQTATLVSTAASPEYRAFVFEGKGHDQVVITVSGASRQAYVALADSTLAPIASGMGRLATSLPYHGPDTEAFYILIKGSPNQKLSVHLTKIPASTVSGVSAESTR